MFKSFYWKGEELPPDDRLLLEQLEGETFSVAQPRTALIRMLRSDSVVTRGIALDFYCMHIANARYGVEPMIDDAVEEAVRAAAIRELGQPPYVRTDATARPLRGANYASALAALANNGDPADASLLARVLREDNDQLVIQEGVRAAQSVLRDEPPHPELGAVLREIIGRSDLDPEIRADAVTAVGATAGDTAIPWLMEALAASELAVSASAARSLLERDFKRYRRVVEPVAAAWQQGEFPPFDAQEVRRMLDERFIEAAGVRLTLTDAAAGLQLDPIRPFEALVWVANDWIHGRFPDLLQRVERGEDAISSQGSVVKAASADMTEEQRAIWFDATGTDVGDDPVLICSDMTHRPLLLPRHALVEILQALLCARAAAENDPNTVIR